MTRRTSWLAALAGASVAALALSSCSATPEGSSSGATANLASQVQADQKTDVATLQKNLGTPTPKSGVKLCYVTRTLANEFWGFERDGFESEAKKLGVQYQTYAVNDESSITEQLDKAQSALNQGCSAILASPISATALDTVFKAALAKGVPPIVLNDAKGTVPGVVYVGPDAETIGQSAADYIAKQLPNGGKVAQIEGDPGSSNALNRGKGFKEGLAKHPNLNLVASQTAKWDTNQAQTIANAMLTANPDIKAFYSQNDGMGLGVQAAIDAKGLTGKVMLVGTDGIPQAKKQIAAGTYTATVSERPTTEGATGVDTALWLLAGKQVPAWVDVPAFVVDKQNVSQYMTGMP
ncbi:substrate-binding domain-containing protein [Sinomonas atrocyanea]|uniref:sugar ABC transporter substrate-binding protein n=1 Tax=Sinomonas atrocyanea TaxID=37927 RepID=UPI00277F9E7C|nr:substrate-binding domain-containing protein [Sinomonas atrocyanea]MDQ0259513.1 ABC-type sugar transport system substrate-binding protein [Sinomonas atrocyanea]MDR6623345.1 ABC-type sugar transport system substrate-binding protein [Sinomonas atrocyanea]